MDFFYSYVNFHCFCSDVALVTSLRDGMNLVSYEYVACQGSKKGVLILSEVADRLCMPYIFFGGMFYLFIVAITAISVCWGSTITWSWRHSSKPLEYYRSCRLNTACFNDAIRWERETTQAQLCSCHNSHGSRLGWNFCIVSFSFPVAQFVIRWTKSLRL